MSSVCKLSRFKSELKYFIIVLNDIPVLQPQPQWIKVVFIVKNRQKINEKGCSINLPLITNIHVR